MLRSFDASPALRYKRLLMSRPTDPEKLSLSKREAGVYREIKPAPQQPPMSDTLTSFVKGWAKAEFSHAVQRVQSYWGASVNVMGQNLRFAAELMNPVISAITQMPSTLFGKPQDPMAKLTSIMSEVMIGRAQAPTGIGLGGRGGI